MFEKLDEKETRMVEIRRYLHQHPELSFQETKTAAFITNFYQGLDCEVQTHVGGNGIVVTIDSGFQGKLLQFELILMHCQFKKKRVCPLHRKILE